MNQYRCEKCTFHTIPIDEIDRCKGEPITIGEFEAYQKRGCVSHSDFQSERDKVLDEIIGMFDNGNYNGVTVKQMIAGKFKERELRQAGEP
jgi:hypothetical protein